jgi:hypothetical protein
MHAKGKDGIKLERRSLRCQAQVCLSQIELATPTIQFGDVNIGTTQTKFIHVRNLSELPAGDACCVTRDL